jgi:hypothetical protein
MRMRALVTAAAALLLMTMGMNSASATVWISGDHGGRIGDYVMRFENLRRTGENVVIDGVCASACTMVLGAVPRNRICVTSRAELGVHSAWHFTADGDREVSALGNQLLWSTYPRSVRAWIMHHGGLHHELLHLQGPALAAMYPTCS